MVNMAQCTSKLSEINEDELEDQKINFFELDKSNSKIKSNINKLPYVIISPQKWIVEGQFINRTHYILASTGGGKTVYSSLLIYYLCKIYNHKKFIIYQFGHTKSALDKLAKIKLKLLTHNISIDILKINNIKTLVKIFETIKEKKFKKTTTESCTDSIRYVFYFDDAAADLTHSKNKEFLTNLISNSRHYKITTLINCQVIKHIPDAIKNQMASLTILGNQSFTNLKVLYLNIPILSEVFPEFNSMFLFWEQVVMKKLKPYTAIIFIKDGKKNKKEIGLYKTNKEFIDLFSTSIKKLVTSLQFNHNTKTNTNIS